MLMTLRAVAEETRIKVLVVLDRGEFSVMEFMQILEMGQSRISRHLKILQSAGIAANRRNGASVLYCLNRADSRSTLLIPSILDWAKTTDWFLDLNKRIDWTLEERKRRSQSYFSSVAHNWSSIRDRYLDFDLYAHRLELAFKGIDRIADLGCGTGDLTLRLVSNGHQVIGVDNSVEMLDRAHTNLKDKIVENRVNLRLGNIEHLPIGDGEVSGVLCSMVLHHLAEPSLVFSEFNRILTRQGVLVVIDFLKHDNEHLRREMGDLWLGFTKKDLTEWLQKKGFSVSGIDLIPTRHDAVQLLYAIAFKHSSFKEIEND